MKYTSRSAKDTMDFAAKLSRSFSGGEIVLLQGDLGSGKTVFSKGIAKGLGIKNTVTSPTFVVFNLYEGKKLKLCHCDAYRLSGDEDAQSTGLTDFLGDKGTVCVIEWPQNIMAALNGFAVIKAQINYIDEKTREIELC